MAGPWEEYQQSAAPPSLAVGPWTEYASQPTVGDGKSLADVITSPDALSADLPQSQTPTPAGASLTDLRDRLRQGDISVLKRMAPGPEAGFPERFLRSGAMLATHLGEQAIEFPLNALIAFTQDPTKGEGLTFNPATNTFGATPEALAAAQAVAGLGGHDVQFGGPRNQMMPPGGPPSGPGSGYRQYVDPTKPFTYNPPAEGWPAGTESWAAVPQNPMMPAGPAFVPPGTPAPLLPRIMDLIRADEQVAANRPAEIPPPGAPVVDEHGNVAPIRQPPNPIDQPGVPRVAPAAEPPPAPPGSAGAMGTPAAMAALSPHEVTMNRSNAESVKLLENQQPGVQDTNVYVEGNFPTEAQIEQTVHTSREDKTLRNLNTDVSQEAREVADRANTNRESHYENNAGSQFDVDAATVKRDNKLDAEISEAFRNKGKADAQGIVDVGQDILNGPDGKVDPVVRVVKNVMDKLYDKDGNLETDPAQLWGVRKQINFLLSKEAAIETPSNQAAARQLIQMRNAVDAAIEPAAPGFTKAIANYAEASRPIEAMQLLQSRQAKLYDALNRMQYSKVQQMMREAVAARHPDAPMNPWQSLSDEQMRQLWLLRDDLRRSSAAEDLARASGSDSVPNMIDVAKQYAGVGLSAIPVLGPMAYRAKAALAPLLDARAARQQRARGMEMLYPDQNKYQLRNQFAPPP